MLRKDRLAPYHNRIGFYMPAVPCMSNSNLPPATSEVPSSHASSSLLAMPFRRYHPNPSVQALCPRAPVHESENAEAMAFSQAWVYIPEESRKNGMGLGTFGPESLGCTALANLVRTGRCTACRIGVTSVLHGPSDALSAIDWNAKVERRAQASK